jgi:hypothetical protein
LVRAFVGSGVAVWLASFMVVTTAVLHLYVPVIIIIKLPN